MTDKDYVFISFEGKMSKDFQSAGVSIGYGSAKKSNETVEKLFKRVEEAAFTAFADKMELMGDIVNS